MKFRILEQRGKFRIEKWSRKESCLYNTHTSEHTEGSFFRKKTIKIVEKKYQDAYEYFELGESKDGSPETPYFGVITYGLGYVTNYVSSNPYRKLTFDTYQKAENYIKKHYGLEGVKGIELPKWRQV